MQLSAISLAITRIDRAGAAGFSPLSLFASGEQGAWYDPSDLSTMFQDRAGTTPVTADGQTVGLILDKSKGLVLGPELVTNGDFSAGATGWISTGGNTTTFTGGVCHVVGSGNSGPYTEVATTPGRSYRITLDAAVVSGGYGVYVYEGGGFATEVVALGQYIRGQFVATTAISRIYIPCFSTPDVTLDNISVRELPGNHAVAPSDAARPLYKTDGTYHWLQFDGVDDSLSTANITLNTSNAVTFFSGVHGSGTNQQVLTELGPTHDTTFPAFCCFYPNTSAQYSKVQEQDTQGYFGIDTANGITATKNTFAFAVNIGTTRIDGRVPWYRINGVTTNQGVDGTPIGSGGSFAVTPLYIASRAGTSRFFKDKIYSYVLLNRLATTDEITATETWVNSKTGAY